MKWQEYQEAVSRLYEQADGLGVVKRNVYIPDSVTGQARQIDCLIEDDIKGHSIKIVVDAKFRRDKIDVKDVEEIISLSKAVRGNKAILVCSNGWTAPAEKKAEHSGVDLRLLELDEALELLVPEKWMMCPLCERDCIVMDQDSFFELGRRIIWIIAGQCRDCKAAVVWCQDCGDQYLIEVGNEDTCYCGHTWLSETDGIRVRLFEKPPEFREDLDQ